MHNTRQVFNTKSQNEYHQHLNKHVESRKERLQTSNDEGSTINFIYLNLVLFDFGVN
jgi:hypothetical protein